MAKAEWKVNAGQTLVLFLRGQCLSHQVRSGRAVSGLTTRPVPMKSPGCQRCGVDASTSSTPWSSSWRSRRSLRSRKKRKSQFKRKHNPHHSLKTDG